MRSPASGHARLAFAGSMLVFGTIGLLRRFMEENGLEDMTGSERKHHEIYLGDPRRTAPERLRTVLRLPVERKRI